MSVPRPNDLDSADFFHLTMAAHQAKLLHSVTAGGGDAEQVRRELGEAQRFSGVRYEAEHESRARAAQAAAAHSQQPVQAAPAPVDARAGFAEIIRQKKEAEARRAAQTEAAKLSNKHHKRGASNAASAATVSDDSIPPPPPPESSDPPAELTYSSSTSRPASKRAAVSAATFAEPEPAEPPPPPPPLPAEVSEEAKLNSLKLARRMFSSLDSTSFELEELLPPSVLSAKPLSNIEKKKKDLNTRQEVCSVLKELCVRRSSKSKHREAIFAPRREQAAVDTAAAASRAVAASAAPAAPAPAETDSRSDDDDDDDDSMVMVCWDANDPMSESRVRLRAGTAHVTQESITATPLLLLDPDADPEMVAAANAAAAMAAGEAMMQRDLLRPVPQRRRSSTPSPPPPPPPVDESVAPVPAVPAVSSSAGVSAAPAVVSVLHSPSGMPGLSAKAHALLNGKSLRQQRPLHLLGMLRTNIGYRFLLLHCYREYSEENILCFKALEAFKRHPTAHTLLSIHEKYVRAGSELMINISSRARQVITEFVNAWKQADSAKKQAMQEKRRTKEGTWNAQNFQTAFANHAAAAATKRALPVAVLPHTPTAAAAASSSVTAPMSPTSDLLSQLPFVLDRAHSEILALLERDSFARFLKTPLFQAYLLGASPPLIMKRAQAVDEAEDLELLASVSGAPAVARTRSPHEGGVSPAHNGSKHADPDFRSLLRGKSKGKRPTGIDTASKYTGIAGPNDEPLSAAATPSSSPPHTPRDPLCIMDRVRAAFRSSPQPPSPLTPRSGGGSGSKGRSSPGPAVAATPVHFVSIGPIAAATTTAAGGARKLNAPPPTRTPPPRPSSSNNLTPPTQRSAAASDATAVHFVFHPPPADASSKLLPVPLSKPRPQALLPMLRTLVGYRFLLAWLYSRREEVPLLAWKAAEIFRQFASAKALRSFDSNFLQTAAPHPLPIEVVTPEQRERVAICLHELESSLPLSRDLPDVLLEIQSSLLSHLACCHAMFKATPLWGSYVNGAGAPMQLRRVCDELASSAATSVQGSVPLAPLVETPAQRHARVELIEDLLAESMMLSEHTSPQARSPISTPRG